MKKIFLLVIIYVCLPFFLYSQECDRTFTTNLTYTNTSMGINYNNLSVSETYRIYQRTNESTNLDCSSIDIKNPIIIVSGYDPFNTLTTTDAYDNYINGTDDKTGDRLRSAGYDIIIYKIGVTQEAIQCNALVLADFIDFINKSKTGNNELVIMGVSLGGVVSRYTLAYMEQNNRPHCTKLFISFDAPQKGANIPLSIQSLVWDLQGVAILSAIAGSTDLLYLLENLNSRAPMQLLTDYSTTIANGYSYPHAYYTAFFNELKSLNDNYGYPKNCKKVTLVDGSNKSGTYVTGSYSPQDDGMQTGSDLWGNYPGSDVFGFMYTVGAFVLKAYMLASVQVLIHMIGQILRILYVF